MCGWWSNQQPWGGEKFRCHSVPLHKHWSTLYKRCKQRKPLEISLKGGKKATKWTISPIKKAALCLTVFSVSLIERPKRRSGRGEGEGLPFYDSAGHRISRRARWRSLVKGVSSRQFSNLHKNTRLVWWPLHHPVSTIISSSCIHANKDLDPLPPALVKHF